MYKLNRFEWVAIILGLGCGAMLLGEFFLGVVLYMIAIFIGAMI